jgi:Ser/Thr protein kinase RdoA (MazF antagonist)
MTGALATHLEARYGIDVARISEMESVHRIDRRDGPAWVARVFPAARPREAVAGDAEILRFLDEHGFPAERCARAEPVSSFEGGHVLVTGFVDGVNGRPDRTPGLLHALGDLLGRLQTLPDGGGARPRPAGSWHHLAAAGGGRGEDVAALAPLLTDAGYAPLHDELAGIDLLDDLPQALLHPDFVTANAMVTPEGPILVDWTGAGRGPRVASLGVLLSSAGPDLALVDAIVAGYVSHVRLEPEELARLPGAVRAFGLVLDCWMATQYPQLLATVVSGLADKREQAEAIAARARAALVVR